MKFFNFKTASENENSSQEYNNLIMTFGNVQKLKQVDTG